MPVIFLADISGLERKFIENNVYIGILRCIIKLSVTERKEIVYITDFNLYE